MIPWELHWLSKHFGPLEGTRVLDVGTGSTLGFWRSLRAAGADCTGIDTEFRTPFPEYLSWPTTDAHWDLVTFRDSLYYLDVDEAAKALKGRCDWVYIKSINPRGYQTLARGWEGRTQCHRKPLRATDVIRAFSWHGFHYVHESDYPEHTLVSLGWPDHRWVHALCRMVDPVLQPALSLLDRRDRWVLLLRRT